MSPTPASPPVQRIASSPDDARAVVDVVILTWNDGPLLDEAVASVRRSVGVDARLIVVDNASQVPASVVGPATVLRNARNRGVAGGRNQGISAGTSPLVCLLDSDARLEPDALRRLVEVASEPGVAVAVPVYCGQDPEHSAGHAPTLWTKTARVLNRTDRYRPTRAPGQDRWDVDFGIGACQVFRRTLWESLGGIDESYFYGPEDVDFCLRAKDAGWRVVQVAGAEVHHPPRRRFRGLATKRGIAHAWCVVRYLIRHRRRLVLGPARSAMGRRRSFRCVER